MTTRRLATTLILSMALAPAFAAEAPKRPLRTSAKSEPARSDPAPRGPTFGKPREITLTATSQPADLALGSDGSVWFAASGLGALGRLNRATGEVTYVPLGNGARPSALAEAPDRTILAADRALNVIHRYNPETGETGRIAMPAEIPFLDLSGLRVDTNGRVWFVGASGWLGSLDPQSGAPDLSSHDDLAGLAAGALAPNGGIWFIAGKSGRMIHIDPQRARFNSAALPLGEAGARGIAVSPRGDVWVTFMKSQSIARLTGRGTWSITRIPAPDSRPQAIIARADGGVVFADGGRRKLVHFRPEANRFEDVAELGAGGAIKAMVDCGDALVIADLGADRLLIVPVDQAIAN